MRKTRNLIYASLLAASLGSCTTELLDENVINPDITSIEEAINGAESIVVTNNGVCENALSAAFGYNAFVLNDVTIESGDTEGAIAMGGNLTVNGAFTVATQSAGAFFDNEEELAASLVVNGQVIYESSEGINLNQGYLKIGDLEGSTVYDLDNNNVASNTRVTPGDYNDTPRILLQRNQVFESVSAPDLIDFDAAFAELNAASSALSQLSNNIIIENGNKITLADTLNVLNVTGEELNNLVNFTFNNKPTISSPLIVNVDAEGEFVWDVQNQAGIGDSEGDFIVYNFFNSSSITIQRTTVIGSVLAPSSDVIKKSSDNINGQVIANSYVHMNGELHQHPFTTCQITEEVPTDETTTTEEEVPTDETVCSLAIELGTEADGESTVIFVESQEENLTYEWSTGSTEDFIIDIPTETTTYTVTVTNQEGCTVTETITITIEPVVPEPVVVPEPTPEPEVCSLTVELGSELDGESTIIFADSQEENLTYEWSNGSTEDFIIDIPVETTTYTVTVTNQEGCTVTESITINIDPVVSVPVITVPEVCSLSIELELATEQDGESTVIFVDTQEENLTYEWSNGSTEDFIIVTSNEPNTTYSVSITNEDGCIAIESITL